MRNIVTTCERYKYLLGDFEKLWNRFDGSEYEIDVAKEGEKKSDQLMRILGKAEEEYLILLEEDFFLLKPTNQELLERAKIFSIERGVDRFSLQAGGIPYYRNNFVEYEGYIVRATDRNICIISLEASIWRRDFLMGILDNGMTDRQIECICSDKVRGKSYAVYGFNQPVFYYKDAVIGGEKRIDIREDGIYLLTQSGWEFQTNA